MSLRAVVFSCSRQRHFFGDRTGAHQKRSVHSTPGQDAGPASHSLETLPRRRSKAPASPRVLSAAVHVHSISRFELSVSTFFLASREIVKILQGASIF